MTKTPSYCCTHLECKRVPLAFSKEGLSCPHGHHFPLLPGTKVPVFARQPENANEYARKNAAEIHDNALRWVFATFKEEETTLRKNLVTRLALTPGMKILVTGAGAGNDLPYLMDALEGQGQIYLQDIATEMLLAAVHRYEPESKGGISLHFSASDATHLPFVDSSFDAAYHFGGINLFPDIQKGIAEMNRVVKAEGKIVFGDEGIAPWLKETEYGRMLIRNNPLYACDAPLRQLPDSARNVKLSWELSNCFYVIEFTVSPHQPAIDIDVPHLGSRGGSIRTRYFGQLEGVDPALRDKVFNEADRRGKSRVEYLESLLRAGISCEDL